MTLKQFVIAGVIVTIPLIFLENMEDNKWSYPYVFLILFSLLVFYSREVSGFVDTLRSAK